MKIIVAQSSAGSVNGLDGYGTALCDFLTSKGHKTQRLDLPSIAAPGHALTNVAAFRLVGTESADALICLDPVAAVLRHPRKFAWLLDHSYLDGDRAQLPAERPSDPLYLANVLRSAVEEASALFSPSRFALTKLHARSFDRALLLRPERPVSPALYARNPGPELLVLNALDDRQRPELLVACLAILPEPFRARWIASSAQRESLSQLGRLAANAGVEHRLATDVRTIDDGEKAYLLAHAAALLDLGQDVLAVLDTVHEAVRNGVPLIACKDGGALTEIRSARAPTRIAEPTGAALAKAVLAACASPDRKSATSAPYAKARATGWTPLLKALSE